MARSEAALVLGASPPASTPNRDPLPAQVFAVGTFGLLVATVAVHLGTFTLVGREWPSLSFWAILVILVNLLPVRVEGLRLTLDLPLLLAVALIYPPEIAAAVAFVATIDPRELTPSGLGFSGALFNRAQVGLSVFVAGTAYRLITVGLMPLHLALVATVAAVSADYLANVGLVSAHLSAKRQATFWSAVRKLTVGRGRGLLATYLGYGVLALVLAHLYELVGAWSVVAFLVPILVARTMLMKSQELDGAETELEVQKLRLERALERMRDERKDERALIAGELHDEVLQLVTKVWMLGRLVEENAEARGTLESDVRELVSVAEQLTVSLRQVMRNLHESPLGQGGVVASLRSLGRELQFGHAARLVLRLPNSVRLAEEAQIAVYQIAREALVNALKHADAEVIELSLQMEGQRACLSVEDDGIGFDVDRVDSSVHFGLSLVADRAQRIGGRVVLRSAKDQGTQLRVEFPSGNPPDSE